MYRRGYQDPPQTGYDTAQICRNGHVITSALNRHPEMAASFCGKCGEPTIDKCEACSAAIMGMYFGGNLVVTRYDPPNNCHNCGGAFPWTQMKLAAASELADELNLSGEEKETVKEKLPYIVQDTPAAKASAFKLRQLLEKAGGAVAGMIRDIVVEVASEAVKKIVLGQ